MARLKTSQSQRAEQDDGRQRMGKESKNELINLAIENFFIMAILVMKLCSPRRAKSTVKDGVKAGNGWPAAA
jgi:hypothetical protein